MCKLIDKIQSNIWLDKFWVMQECTSQKTHMISISSYITYLYEGELIWNTAEVRLLHHIKDIPLAVIWLRLELTLFRLSRCTSLLTVRLKPHLQGHSLFKWSINCLYAAILAMFAGILASPIKYHSNLQIKRISVVTFTACNVQLRSRVSRWQYNKNHCVYVFSLQLRKLSQIAFRRCQIPTSIFIHQKCHSCSSIK